MHTHTHTHTHVLIMQKPVEFEIVCMICTSMAINSETGEVVSLYTHTHTHTHTHTCTRTKHGSLSLAM